MNTTASSSASSLLKFSGLTLARLRAAFRRLDAASLALAASLASEVRSRPELPDWILSVARMPRWARSASLLRAAMSLSRDPRGFEAADALKRMAARPSVFRAVLRELQTTAPLAAA